MDDHEIAAPSVLAALLEDTERIGFTLASEPRTGALLRTLAASKPGGRMLEIGTGTGVGTAWLLAGMDAGSRLTSVDNDTRALDVARRHLGRDARVTFHHGDGAAYLEAAQPGELDLIYADAWPGKFTHVDEALRLLRPGGIYFIDDLLPQPGWPAGHAARVPEVIAGLEARRDVVPVRLAWASGLMVLVRTSPSGPPHE